MNLVWQRGKSYVLLVLILQEESTNIHSIANTTCTCVGLFLSKMLPSLLTFLRSKLHFKKNSAVANNMTTHSSRLDAGVTHLWRVVGVEATPGAVWTRARAGWTLHGHLRDELSQRAGRDRWRATRVGRDVEGKSCRRAGEPPVGCRSLCLMVH